MRLLRQVKSVFFDYFNGYSMSDRFCGIKLVTQRLAI